MHCMTAVSLEMSDEPKIFLTSTLEEAEKNGALRNVFLTHRNRFLGGYFSSKEIVSKCFLLFLFFILNLSNPSPNTPIT